MSGTVTPPTASLLTPQTIIGLVGMAIVAATVGAMLMWGDNATRAQTVGGVLGMGGAIVAYYFGSSHGSQAKDATIAAAVAEKPAPAPNPAP